MDLVRNSVMCMAYLCVVHVMYCTIRCPVTHCRLCPDINDLCIVRCSALIGFEFNVQGLVKERDFRGEERKK
jgi:hypothetical protein